MIGVLVNPNYDPDAQVRDVQVAADTIGLQVKVLPASSVEEIDKAFAAASQQVVAALFVANDPYLDSHRDQIIALAARAAIPAMYYTRAYTAAGGLISYGANIADAYRQAGIYTGKILKGAKPAELPVLQPTKFDLVINLITAKALGLTIPATVLARADETARIHRAARRHGGRVAARGAGPTVREATDHWVLGRGLPFCHKPMDRRFCAATPRTRLDRGPHSHDRVSLGGRRKRARGRDRGRVRPPQSRCHCHLGKRGRRGKAGDVAHSDCLRGGE